MAHFAQLDESLTVTQVIVVNNDTINNFPYPQSEPVGISFCQSLFGLETNWKQTSYNGSFRKNFAGIGYIYDFALDGFIPPQPYPSWLLNQMTCKWEPPVPYPSDGNVYIWDENTQLWVKVDPNGD